MSGSILPKTFGEKEERNYECILDVCQLRGTCMSDSTTDSTVPFWGGIHSLGIRMAACDYPCSAWIYRMAVQEGFKGIKKQKKQEI